MLKNNNKKYLLSYYQISAGQEFRRCLAGWFWLGISPEAAIMPRFVDPLLSAHSKAGAGCGAEVSVSLYMDLFQD